MTYNRAILGTEISTTKIYSFELHVFVKPCTTVRRLLNLGAKEEMFSSDLSSQPS